MNEIERLKTALEFAQSNGKSKADVAHDAGFDYGTINKWLRGYSSPSCINLSAVINACGFDVDLTLRVANV